MLKGRTTTKQEQDPKDTKRSNIGITIQKDKEIERKISDVKTQHTGPNPTEKKATFPQTNRIANAITKDPCGNKERLAPMLNKQIFMPIVLTKSSGLLPFLSIRKIATNIKRVFVSTKIGRAHV